MKSLFLYRLLNVGGAGRGAGQVINNLLNLHDLETWDLARGVTDKLHRKNNIFQALV